MISVLLWPQFGQVIVDSRIMPDIPQISLVLQLYNEVSI
jgi:hypothetical protein